MPDSLTTTDIVTFQEAIQSEAAEAIKRVFEYRGENLAEEVAGNMKVKRT